MSVLPTQNPLVARYTVTTALGGCPGQVMIEFGPDTSYGRSTAWYPVVAARNTSTILVAGMKASTTYHMRAQAQAICPGATNTFVSADKTFTTGALPALPFPSLAVSRPSPSASSPENPGIELVDVTNAGTPALFTDRDANPIWYYDVGQGNFAFTYKLLPNGHIILSITLAGINSVLREVDLTGRTIREMYITELGQKVQSAGYGFAPTAYHHDLLPLANGHVIVLTSFTKDFTDLPGYPGTTSIIGDGIVDLDQNWNPVWAWNSFDHLDVNRHLSGLPDWTHSNALIYSAEDGNLILSVRHQSWVLKIDYNNGAGAGDILWKLGYQGDFTLTQGTDPSLWFSFQHFPSVVSQSGRQTTISIWDNGDNRVLDTSGTVCGAVPLFTPCYSRATIFEVDESTLSANLLWDDLPGDFSVWGGSINQLSNGNVEFDMNDPAQQPNTNLGSEVEEVTQTSTPQIVWKLDVDGTNAYRAYRVPSLYPGVTWQY
ncbi:MAG TPA: aryl-sulfate sulfotransferase [Candidatus Acidoferrum sp.]|nr:aryl-sulfate sulfotransferase [Candidatus Acidoferrum sp.]